MPRAVRKGRLIGLILASSALAVLIDGTLIEPNRLVRRQVTIPSPHLASGPVRILLFADVNFASPGRRERALRRAALEFEPDLVLVAGDFFEHPKSIRDAGMLESATEYLASLPAPSGRFLCPGERESEVAEQLARAWSEGTIEVLSNESRSLDVRGARIDLFGADPDAVPAPWGIGREQGRTFVRSRGQHKNQILIYRGEGADAWGSAEFTFAFQAAESDSLLDFRFAWQPGSAPWEGAGWRLVRHEYRRDFRLYHHARKGQRLIGRSESGFVPPPGVWCRARIRYTEDGARGRVRARFWRESEEEPADWSIDAHCEAPDRSRQGTVAFGGRAGGRRYSDLRIVTPDGGVLLEEPFSDPARLRGVWSYPSPLADWIFRAGPTDAVRIVLTHNPDLVLDLADIGGPWPDLVVAGHTHGGQVRVPGIGALYTSTRLGRRYDSGLFSFGGGPLYITAGVGTSVVPVRLFDPPEVTLLTLVPAP